MNNVQLLADKLNNPIVVTLGGNEFSLKRLTRRDIALAAEFLRNRRQQQYMNATRMMPMGDAARGLAQAEIACRTISLDDILQDPDGYIKLLQLQLCHSGKDVTFEFVRDELTADAHASLVHSLLRISGIAKEPSADPLEDTITSPGT